MSIIDKVALIYVRDGKVLKTLSKGKDKYYLPGGKRETNETDEETLTREIFEELTVKIKKDTIKYYGTFEAQADGKAEGVIVKTTCYMAEFEGELKANSEIEKLVWLDSGDMNKVSAVGKIILNDLMAKGLIK